MPPRRPLGIIRPKISNMPRNKSEASSQLELYKLVTEKQRLQQELQLVEQRTQQINQRLSVLNNLIIDTEKNIQEMRVIDPQVVEEQKKADNNPNNSNNSNNFNTFYLEY